MVSTMNPEKPSNSFNKETRCYYCLCEIKNDMTLFMSHDKTFCSNYHRNLVVHAQNYSEQPSSVALAPYPQHVPTKHIVTLSSVHVSTTKKRSIIDKLIDNLFDKLNMC